eukprot:3748649-Amphidinium_carterae.1
MKCLGVPSLHVAAGRATVVPSDNEGDVTSYNLTIFCAVDNRQKRHAARMRTESCCTKLDGGMMMDRHVPFMS